MQSAILATAVVGACAALISVVVQLRGKQQPEPIAEPDPDHPLKRPAWLVGVILGLIGVVEVIRTVTSFI